MGYLIGGALNKTHILVFQYSSWFEHKIYLKIHVVILQRKSCSDPTATEFDPAATRTFPILVAYLTFDKTMIVKTLQNNL